MMIECQKALYLCCGDVGQRMFHQGPDGYSQQALSQPNNLNLFQKSSTCHSWSRCNRVSLVSLPEICFFFTRLAPLLQLQS